MKNIDKLAHTHDSRFPYKIDKWKTFMVLPTVESRTQNVFHTGTRFSQRILLRLQINVQKKIAHDTTCTPRRLWIITVIITLQECQTFFFLFDENAFSQHNNKTTTATAKWFTVDGWTSDLHLLVMNVWLPLFSL